MRVHDLIAAAAFVACLGACGADAEPRVVPLESGAWTTGDEMVGDGSIVFEDHLGRRAMRLTGAAMMEGVTLKDGVIEYDVAFENTRGFAGVVFRRPDMRDGETFYMRSHRSGNPDANQYTPIFNGLTAWQIYSGPQYASPVEYRYGEWMTVRVIVNGDEAEIHLDGEPILHIDDLLRVPIEGGVSLWTNIAPAWFSNISVNTETPAFEMEPSPSPVTPPGTIGEWEVSEEFPWRRVARADEFDRDWVEGLEWTVLEVERNGIANLGRVADRRDGNTVFARVTVPAKHAGEFRFGFSDAARAYVNGGLVFEGDDTYGSRDYRHLGTVGLYDTLFTEPQGEQVTFTFAVREQFGGWAVAGAAPASVPVRTTIDTKAGERAEAIHETMVEFHRDGFSGAIVAAENGKPILEAGYGQANRAEEQSFTPGTIAQIGSITKMFTSLAVIDLSLQGEIELDAPVSRYLPEAAAPARGVTIHQLLTHTSGMPEYCGRDFDRTSLQDLLIECMGQPLRFEPGAEAAYSNPAYSVLAAVVEAASGRSLETYLDETLLGPNDLKGITYFPPDDAAPAHGYTTDGRDEGVISDRIAALEGDFWELKGNGGMQASARDMFGFYDALAGRRALSDAHMVLAFEPRAEARQNVFYGYGWVIEFDEAGETVEIRHSGSDGVFFSYFWWAPQTDRFFYLVGNSGEQRTIEAVRAARRFMME